jgi:steroid 5-alpha reductase family enzyme
MSAAGILAATAGFGLAAMAVVWTLSLARRDAGVADVWWGPGFGALGLCAFVLAGGSHPRRVLVLALVLAWGLRLGLHLVLRSRGRGEDFRYAAMRRRHGARFPLLSLFSVFGLQGVLQWIVALPVLVVQVSPGPPGLGLFDALGTALFAAGLLVESVADWQLARFRADPAQAGRVLERGLWGWSRHPNYFGDFLVWWGLFGITLASPHGLAALPGPLLMSFLLMRVSGVPLLERSLARRRAGWSEYAARTPAFFPVDFARLRLASRRALRGLRRPPHTPEG